MPDRDFRRIDRFIRNRGIRTFFLLVKDEETGKGYVAQNGDEEWLRQSFQALTGHRQEVVDAKGQS